MVGRQYEGACITGCSVGALNGNPGGCYKSSDNAAGMCTFYSSEIYFNTDLSLYYGSYLNFNLKQKHRFSNKSLIMLLKRMVVYNTEIRNRMDYSITEAGWKYSTWLRYLEIYFLFIRCNLRIGIILYYQQPGLKLYVTDIVVLPIN